MISSAIIIVIDRGICFIDPSLEFINIFLRLLVNLSEILVSLRLQFLLERCLLSLHLVDKLVYDLSCKVLSFSDQVISLNKRLLQVAVAHKGAPLEV